MIRLRISLLAILMVALAIASAAGPWTGGRGPGNQGVFPDVSFPSTPAVVWKAYLGSEYKNLLPSNTLVAGENVIVAFDKHLLAISTRTGEPRWKTVMHEPPLSDILLLSDKIIVTTQHGIVLAFNPATGEQIWRCRLADRVRNGPVQLGELLLYTTKSNTIEAIDLTDSGPIKQSTRIIKAPNKIEAGAVALGRSSYLLCFTDGTLMRLEEEGINRWSIKLPNTVLGLTPVTNGNIAIITTANGIYCVNPFERDAGKSVRWMYPSPDRAADPAILFGDRVYVATRLKTLHAIDLATGKDVWTHTETKRAQDAVKSGLQLPSVPVGQPILIGDNLLVRMEHGLVAMYHKDTGELVWLYQLMTPTGAEVPKRYYAGSLAIDGDDIYFAGTDTYIYRLSKTAPDTEPPTFSWVLPANADRGYVTSDKLPYLGAVISDEGTGLHAGLVEMKLDGTDLTPAIQHDAQTGYYYVALNPAMPLDNGLHHLTITAKDHRGNAGTLKQSFIVAGPSSDFIEIQIGGEFVPRSLTVRPGTVISWRNTAGGARTVVSDAAEGLLKFSSDDAYPDGIPDKERWVWTVPEDVEPGAKIFYYCRLYGKPSDGETVGDGLAGLLQVVDDNPLTVPTGPTTPVYPPGFVPGGTAW
jgi:outer membrane protein assembly factor BamB